MTNISLDELTQVLQEKLELKRKCIELEGKYIEMLARYLQRDASIWTYQFEEDKPITEENLEQYVSWSLWRSNQYTKQDLLKAVQWLYDAKFNKR